MYPEVHPCLGTRGTGTEIYLGKPLFSKVDGQWCFGTAMQWGVPADSSGLERRPWGTLAGAGAPRVLRFTPSLETAGIAPCARRCLWRWGWPWSRGIPRDRVLILEPCAAVVVLCVRRPRRAVCAPPASGLRAPCVRTPVCPHRSAVCPHRSVRTGLRPHRSVRTGLRSVRTGPVRTGLRARSARPLRPAPAVCAPPASGTRGLRACGCCHARVAFPRVRPELHDFQSARDPRDATRA